MKFRILKRDTLDLPKGPVELIPGETYEGNPDEAEVRRAINAAALVQIEETIAPPPEINQEAATKGGRNKSEDTK